MLLLWFKGLDPVEGLSYPPSLLQCVLGYGSSVCVRVCWSGDPLYVSELIYTHFISCLLSHLYNTVKI